MRDGKYVILCVDDDDDVILFLRTVLEAKGYLVETANTAEDGLKAYKAASADLIVVDLMMEQVDAGTHLVKELKLLGNTSPIYMLSSVGDNLSMTTDYTSLGLSGVFQKPLAKDYLLAVLKTKLAEAVET